MIKARQAIFLPLLIVATVLIVYFVLELWGPLTREMYIKRINSSSAKEQVQAFEYFLVEKPDVDLLKRTFKEGPKAVDLLRECWTDVNRKIEKPEEALALLQVDDDWKTYPARFKPLSYLHVATFNGWFNTAKIIIERGGDIESNATFIFRKNIDTNKYKYNHVVGTPLHAASFHQREKIASYLISKGANCNSVDVYDRTPLIFASLSGNLRIAGVLIENGAKPDCKDDVKRTPLFWASGMGHSRVAKLLIEKGASINSVDSFGFTPFMTAIENNRPTTVKLLLNHKVNVNCRLSGVGLKSTPEGRVKIDRL